MKKQTSVDWLAEQIKSISEINTIGKLEYDYFINQVDSILQTARKMHREEVEEAYDTGIDDENKGWHNLTYYTDNFQTP